MNFKGNSFSVFFLVIVGIFLFSKINAQTGAVPTFRENPSQNEKTNQSVQITLHKAKLDKNEKVQYQDEASDKVVTGSALFPDDIKSGFKANEKVVIRVKSPYPYYIYIVNVSDLDGTNLVHPYKNVAADKQHPADDYKDFLYSFSKSSSVATSREDFLIIISKTKIESEKLGQITKDGGIILSRSQTIEAKKQADPATPTTSTVVATSNPTVSTTPSTTATTAKPNKWVKVYSFGCQIVGIFVPFLNDFCPKTSLGALPEFKDSQLTVSPSQNQDLLTFAISFTISQ